MKTAPAITRPATLAEVARASDSLASFGMNLRDWQHEIQRGGVRSRPEFERRLIEKPTRCQGRFPGGDIADAYLAAYAEWLADRAGIARPGWANDPSRVAVDPWFATPLRGRLLVTTPASFRHRNVFTTPEPVFRPAAGRPRVSAEQKRQKACLRQKAYRQRIRALVEKARRLEDAR
jgi:hypothetical protein